MEDYTSNFIDETSKLMSKLENNLLEVEKSPENSEIISDIFRIIHSIKGAAGMFGFEGIQNASHSVEDLFTEIKAGNLKINSEIIDICFNLIDFIEKSFSEKKIENLNVLEKNIIDKVKNYINFTEKDYHTHSKTISTFYIYFHPDNDFEQRSINLMSILKDIESSGEFLKFEKPYFPLSDNQDEDRFYMYWEYFVTTDRSLDDLEDIFVFFDTGFKIRKIADISLVSNSEFIQKTEDNQEASSYFSDRFIEELILNYSIENTPEKNEELQDIEISEPDSRMDIISIKRHQTKMITVESDKLDKLMNLVSELITNKEGIKIISQREKIRDLTEITDNLEKISRNIQNISIGLRLVPISSIMTKFERLVRSLSADLGKKVHLDTAGTDTELDKTVIDNIAEPILHIIRNCIDHGIEYPDERILKGKQESGRINFIASYSGNDVIIQIHDDGRGIDVEKIQRKALKTGLIQVGSQKNKKEIMNLIFLPGFTTTEEVTDISGRGIGMDIVMKKIVELRGDVTIDSEPGLGTYITIRVPLTLSIVDTLQVIVNNSIYLLPKNCVSTIIGVSIKEVEENYRENHVLNGDLVPVFNLKKRFGKYTNKEKGRIVFVFYKDKQYGFAVDDILGEHQAVLKPLSTMFNTDYTFTGASILGNGTLALMIDVNKIIETSLRETY